MKCRENDDKNNKCECKACNNMENNYCKYFRSDNMCQKCDWSGCVTYCPNKTVDV